MFTDWNNTQKDYARDKCIHELFEAQVERTPEAVAVVSEDQQLTYHELNCRANQLAYHLQDLGVEPEALVGICMERSSDMVVGLLGILKAGGAYVPLDPEYPKERLDFILKDSQPSILLTQARLVAELPARRAQLVYLDTDWPGISQQTDQNPRSNASAGNLAYVIYTSGSTGKPKGVMITHANLCHFVQTVQVMLDVTADDIYLHTASITYALSVRQLMVPLCQGSTVVVATSEQVRDTLALFDVIKQQGVTMMDFVPSHWRTCVQTLAGLKPDSRTDLLYNKLRQIVCVGEPLSSDLPREWTLGFKHGARLVNVFGQTETTGLVTVFPILATDEERVKVVPIGRAVANTHIYILDPNMRPVLADVPGELFIGGPGLARGYLNRPELTVEKFIPDPFTGEPGVRLYKTGDLACYGPDGNIEYLGRVDQQVKIRGIRIELGEIEAVLRQHPVVREAVVITQEDTPGDKQLIAYVLPKLKQSPTVSELRSFLKEKLPEYMIPSVFVMLEALPLTPNGKVDRRALPAPDQGRPEVETAFAAPRDSLELQLTKIWENLLGIQPVGVQDDFFELGGHSLLAVKLTAQIEKAFGKHFPPAALFQAPTIEQLASILRQEKWSDSWSSLVPIQPGGSKLPFFWIHGDSSNAFLPRYLGPNQPLYGLMHQSEDGKPALYTKVETIAAHYLKEIRTVQPEGPYFLGGYSFGGTVAFEMAQQLKKQGQDVPLLVLLDSHFPGDDIPDSRSILTNVTLFRTEAHRHLRNLALPGPQEKLAYVLVRVKGTIKGKIKERTERINKILKKAVCKICLVMDRPIPFSLRSAYILDIYYQARRNYVPQLYPGRAIYFKSEKRSSDHQLNWGRLIAGGLESYEAPGDHVDMIKQPNAHFWAEKLKACLYKVQSKEASCQPDRLQEGVESTVNNRPILPSDVRLRWHYKLEHEGRLSKVSTNRTLLQRK